MGTVDPNENKPSSICRHCNQSHYKHAEGDKCLFEATTFEPKTYGEIADEASALFQAAMEASGFTKAKAEREALFKLLKIQSETMTDKENE